MNEKQAIKNRAKSAVRILDFLLTSVDLRREYNSAVLNAEALAKLSPGQRPGLRGRIYRTLKGFAKSNVNDEQKHRFANTFSIDFV
jgi:hypothetical protein